MEVGVYESGVLVGAVEQRLAVSLPSTISKSPKPVSLTKSMASLPIETIVLDCGPSIVIDIKFGSKVVVVVVVVVLVEVVVLVVVVGAEVVVLVVVVGAEVVVLVVVVGAEVVVLVVVVGAEVVVVGLLDILLIVKGNRGVRSQRIFCKTYAAYKLSAIST